MSSDHDDASVDDHSSGDEYEPPSESRVGAASEATTTAGGAVSASLPSPAVSAPSASAAGLGTTAALPRGARSGIIDDSPDPMARQRATLRLRSDLRSLATDPPSVRYFPGVPRRNRPLRARITYCMPRDVVLAPLTMTFSGGMPRW
jgi:hypothetical protein